MLSFGEAHTMRKLSMFMKKGKWVFIDLPNHLERMDSVNAAKYYTEKISREMGWRNKSQTRFELMFEDVLQKALRDRDRLCKREWRKINKELAA